MKNMFQFKNLKLTALILFCAAHVAHAEATTKLKVGRVEDGRKATATLNELFSAYSNGDTASLRNLLDPKMIGFQNLLDNVTTDTNTCKQMRFHLTDTQVQVAPDIVVIQTNWEKRCLLLPGLTPQLTSGHSTFLLQTGSGGGFSVTGISGATPFKPPQRGFAAGPPTI